MNRGEISETIFSAIDIILAERLRNISFDQTIECVIVDNSQKKLGEYIVNDSGVEYKAYSNLIDYENGDRVLVMIPQGDYDNQKIIVGKKKDNEAMPYTYQKASTQMLDITGNIIDDSDAQKITGIQANGFIFYQNQDNTNTTLLQQYSNLYDNAINRCSKKLVWEQSFDVPYSGYNRMCLSGDFIADLGIYNTVSGNYGLLLELIFQPDPGLLQTDNENNSYYNIADYSSAQLLFTSSEDFYGTIYNQSTYFHQEIVFDISQYKNQKIEAMRLFLFQNQDFLNDTNHYIHSDNYNQEALYAILSQDGSISNVSDITNLFQFYQRFAYDDNSQYVFESTRNYVENIKVKNIYIGLGYDAASFTDDAAYLFSNSGLTYNNELPDENNKKFINLRWIHKFENIVKIVTPHDLQNVLAKEVQNNSIAAGNTQSDTIGYHIKWYRFDIGAESPDSYTGSSWRAVAEWTSNQPENIDQALTYGFIPSASVNSETFKVVITKNGSVIAESGEISFLNERDTENITQYDIENALNIACGHSKQLTGGNNNTNEIGIFNYDAENGVFFIYGIDNKLQETSKKSEIFYLTPFFNSKYDEPTAIGQDILTEANVVIWSFPAQNSMLIPSFIPISPNGSQFYLDFDKKKDIIFSRYQPNILNKEREFYKDKITTEGDPYQKYLKYFKDQTKKRYLLEVALPPSGTIENNDPYYFVCYTQETEEAVDNNTRGIFEFVFVGQKDENNNKFILPTFATQTYSIPFYYNSESFNNTVSLKVYRHDTEYHTKKTFYFGQAGTNGSRYTLRIIYKDKAAQVLTLGETNSGCYDIGDNDVDKQLIVEARLFDPNNKDITDEVLLKSANSTTNQPSLSWSWDKKQLITNGRTTNSSPRIEVEQGLVLYPEFFARTSTAGRNQNLSSKNSVNPVTSSILYYKTEPFDIATDYYFKQSQNYLTTAKECYESDKQSFINTYFYYDVLDGVFKHPTISQIENITDGWLTLENNMTQDTYEAANNRLPFSDIQWYRYISFSSDPPEEKKNKIYFEEYSPLNNFEPGCLLNNQTVTMFNNAEELYNYLINTKQTKLYIKVNNNYIIDIFNYWRDGETYYYPVSTQKQDETTFPDILQISGSGASKINERRITINTANFWSSNPKKLALEDILNSINVLKVTLEHFGDYNLSDTEPIAIRPANSTCAFISGPTEIAYNESGAPDMDQSKFIGYDIYGQEISGEWKLFYSDTGVDFTEAEKEQFFPKISNGIFKPLSIYIEDLPAFGIQLINSENEILWAQPINIYENKYFSSKINDWDGNTISTDDDTGTIIAPAIAAGKKDPATNTFSGVVLGDWTKSGASTSITKQTGLYGFHKGAMSFAFTEDGTGFIGKSGRGRILFDGNNSIIQSSNWQLQEAGMKIDLDDGILEAAYLSSKLKPKNFVVSTQNDRPTVAFSQNHPLYFYANYWEPTIDEVISNLNTELYYPIFRKPISTLTSNDLYSRYNLYYKEAIFDVDSLWSNEKNKKQKVFFEYYFFKNRYAPAVIQQEDNGQYYRYTYIDPDQISSLVSNKTKIRLNNNIDIPLTDLYKPYAYEALSHLSIAQEDLLQTGDEDIQRLLRGLNIFRDDNIEYKQENLKKLGYSTEEIKLIENINLYCLAQEPPVFTADTIKQYLAASLGMDENIDNAATTYIRAAYLIHTCFNVDFSTYVNHIQQKNNNNEYVHNYIKFFGVDRTIDGLENSDGISIIFWERCKGVLFTKLSNPYILVTEENHDFVANSNNSSLYIDPTKQYYAYDTLNEKHYITLSAKEEEIPFAIGSQRGLASRKFYVEWDGTLHAESGKFNGWIDGAVIRGGYVNGGYLRGGIVNTSFLQAAYGRLGGWLLMKDIDNNHTPDSLLFQDLEDASLRGIIVSARSKWTDSYYYISEFDNGDTDDQLLKKAKDLYSNGDNEIKSKYLLEHRDNSGGFTYESDTMVDIYGQTINNNKQLYKKSGTKLHPVTGIYTDTIHIPIYNPDTKLWSSDTANMIGTLFGRGSREKVTFNLGMQARDTSIILSTISNSDTAYANILLQPFSNLINLTATEIGSDSSGCRRGIFLGRAGGGGLFGDGTNQWDAQNLIGRDVIIFGRRISIGGGQLSDDIKFNDFLNKSFIESGTTLYCHIPASGQHGIYARFA